MGAETLVTSELNRQARASLVDRIAAGETALFAGAGVAVPAGFPSWNRLLEGLESVCDSVGDGFVRDPAMRADNHLIYAEEIKRHVEKFAGSLAPYETCLHDTFRSAPQLKQFHRDLVALRFRGFITTNYDRTLETALAESELEPSDKAVVVGVDDSRMSRAFLANLAVAGAARLVAHIHGYYKQPSQIVLSEKDYARVYGLDGSVGKTVLSAFLGALLGFASLVFVGFSFQDEQIGNFLAATSNLFALAGSRTHYAIIGTTPDSVERDRERARQYMMLGIQTVFYEQIRPSGVGLDEHQQLYDMINAFCRETGVKQRPPAIVDFNDDQADRMRG